MQFIRKHYKIVIWIVIASFVLSLLPSVLIR